jgi:ABC-type Mn2+/Zn2+ transport system permease subunit
VPASCAAIFFAGIAQRFFAGWLVGTAACGAGIAASAFWDLPTGAAVVAALGVVFALAALGSIFSGAAD